MTKPFVSFIVMAYNAEKFIAEAVDGAFAQTYDNMEIIISDDCSTDNTFAVIQDKVNAYMGSKPIRVLRNEKNLGIGAHLNKLWWDEAKGDWIVPSAGDDVSLPNRVDVMMNRAKSNIGLINANFIQINSNSEIVPKVDYIYKSLEILESKNIQRVILSGINVVGCCMALNKSMLIHFGPFLDGLVNEDVALAYRAIAFGDIIYIPEPLVKYRIHNSSISFTTTNFVDFPNWKMKKQDLSFKANSNYYLMKQIIKDIPKLSIENSDFLFDKFLTIRIFAFIYGSEKFSWDFIKSKIFYLEIIKYILYPLKYRIQF